MTLLCMTLLTYAHDLAVGHETGAQLRVLKVLCSHQHADDLPGDESVVKALLSSRLGWELAVHVQRPLGVRWLQHLHQFDVGVVHLWQEVRRFMRYGRIHALRQPPGGTGGAQDGG